MPSCKDSGVWTSVTISSRTTNCILPASDTAKHVLEITNARASRRLRDVEITTYSLANKLNFGTGGLKKVVTTVPLVGAPGIHTESFDMSHGEAAAYREDVRNTIEFFDESQLLLGAFVGLKERHSLAFDMDLTP